MIMGSSSVIIEGHEIKIRFAETKGDNILHRSSIHKNEEQHPNQEYNESSDEDSRQGDFSDGESQAPGNRSDSEDDESEFVANTCFASPETNGKKSSNNNINAENSKPSLDNSVNNCRND
ncbi:hypothetical protein LXL04_000817 [Taraxacum kok-saghyz]